ncbi:hypothetical protein ACFPOD_02385 [Nitratireductor kimnyeongensis]|uniref:Uncharacterized protein n=1 Tax=Nitratireductor kimnyeongensis TaxID=430679 RepID=A0ABW0T4Q0_9HYPH|nr:hypothetical protein [Nitratireductor kimnyeongensis]QZZ35035.1 hypothetical protein KW403_14805 [Nitratireductor kimnyeongensis]
MPFTLTPALRRTLHLDAMMSGAAALLLVFAAAPLSRLLALPEELLFWAGVILVTFVVMLLVIAARKVLPRLLLMDVVLLNAVWAVLSFALLASGWVSPNLLGMVFVSAQACAVALFALLQFAAMREAQS